MEPYSIARRHRPRRQRARGEPAGAEGRDPRRHRVRDDEPAARRRPARHGGAAPRRSNWPLGGKTGTTDDYTDAWFIGFDPDITVGVWVGFDQKKPIGAEPDRRRSGAADLDRHHEGLDRRDRKEPPTFEAPGNIVFVTGRHRQPVRSPTRSAGAISEAFIAGTQPGSQAFSADRGLTPRPAPAVPERARRLPHQVRLDELVDVAVEHAVDVALLVLRAVVLDHLVRVQHVAADLAAEGDVLLLAADLSQLGLLLLHLQVVQPRLQHLHRRRRGSCAATARSGTRRRCRSAGA